MSLHDRQRDANSRTQKASDEESGGENDNMSMRERGEKVKGSGDEGDRE